MRSLTCGWFAGMLLASTTALADEPPPSAMQARSGLQGPDGAMPSAPPLADRIHMRLDYAGAAGCAEAELFRDAARIHIFKWEPFAPISPWPLRVRVARNGPGYEGQGELRTQAGELFWSDAAPGPMKCVDVLLTLAESLSITVLPLPLPQPTPKPEPPVCPEQPALVCPSELEPLPPPIARTEPTKPPPETPPLTIRVGIAGGPELITTDRGSVGFMLDASVRYHWFSAGIEAHGSPPLGATAGDNTVSFARLTGALLLCLHFFDWLLVCSKGEAGEILFPGQARLPTRTYGAVGGRIGLEYPVSPRISIRVAADLLGTINPPIDRAAIGQQTLFQLAGGNLGLGLGALWAWAP